MGEQRVFSKPFIPLPQRRPKISIFSHHLTTLDVQTLTLDHLGNHHGTNALSPAVPGTPQTRLPII
jgi:hypothetical protein